MLNSSDNSLSINRTLNGSGPVLCVFGKPVLSFDTLNSSGSKCTSCFYTLRMLMSVSKSRKFPSSDVFSHRSCSWYFILLGTNTFYNCISLISGGTCMVCFSKLSSSFKCGNVGWWLKIKRFLSFVLENRKLLRAKWRFHVFVWWRVYHHCFPKAILKIFTHGQVYTIITLFTFCIRL